MIWTKDDQARLDRLRADELAGTLTADEKVELGNLMARVESEEAQVLAPEMDRLRAEASELQSEFDAVQRRNEELARLLAQQQILAADARRFLAEFDKRQASILDALARFGREPLSST